MEQIPYFGTPTGPARPGSLPTAARPEAHRPPGWRPPADNLNAAGTTQGRSPLASRRGFAGGANRAAIALVVAGLAAVVALIVQAVVSGGSKPSAAAAGAAAKADVITMGTAISGYYRANDGPLTLTTRGNAWVITNVEGDVVGSGGVSQSNEVVTASKLTGPGAWCVALAPKGNPAQGWHFAAPGGVATGGTCR